jgi:hypothetical protein
MILRDPLKHTIEYRYYASHLRSDYTVNILLGSGDSYISSAWHRELYRWYAYFAGVISLVTGKHYREQVKIYKKLINNVAMFMPAIWGQITP